MCLLYGFKGWSCKMLPPTWLFNLINSMWEQRDVKGVRWQCKESCTCVPKDVLSVQIYVKSIDEQGRFPRVQAQRSFKNLQEKKSVRLTILFNSNFKPPLSTSAEQVPTLGAGNVRSRCCAVNYFVKQEPGVKANSNKTRWQLQTCTDSSV